jgi:tRNA(fMet)-specific endonuclease VapC
MLRYMLDTNTCIRALRADATSRLAGRFNRHATQLCISSIVLAELQFGAENSKRVAENLGEIAQFVARLQAVLDFDAAAAAEYGRVRAALRRNPIGPLDTLIVAHARSRNLVVVTGNVAEFKRVPGLQIENWQNL